MNMKNEAEFKEALETLMVKCINELCSMAHEDAIDHGWWDEKRTFGELIVLVHSELSEAIEEYRNHHQPTEKYYSGDKRDKPEGIPSELADVVIRVMDICGYYGIDLGKAIVEKMAYNKTRPNLHGGKKL